MNDVWALSHQNPVINDLPKRGRNDVGVAKMSISAPPLHLLGHDCGPEVDILATSTSFRHLFDKSFLTGNDYSLLGQHVHGVLVLRLGQPDHRPPVDLRRIEPLLQDLGLREAVCGGHVLQHLW